MCVCVCMKIKSCINDLCLTSAFGNNRGQVTKNKLMDNSLIISFDLYYYSLVPEVVKMLPPQLDR